MQRTTDGSARTPLLARPAAPAVPAMTRPPPSATTPCRLYRVPEAMQLLSLSRTTIYEQIRSGRLRSVTQGRTRLIPAEAIADYVALLVREATADAGTT